MPEDRSENHSLIGFGVMTALRLRAFRERHSANVTPDKIPAGYAPWTVIEAALMDAPFELAGAVIAVAK